MAAVIARRLRAVAGDDALLAGDPAAAFAAHGPPPAAVVAPATAAGVAAVLALCSAEGWHVQPAGAGTWLRGVARRSNGPAAGDDAPAHDGAGASSGAAAETTIILSTRRLDAVHEYEPADLTAGAGAGASLDALRARLAEHRQWLALDPPASPGATLGAVLALGHAGPLRHAFGTPRDAALGLEVATGDGRLLHFGGRVVKNVAGYDVVRLLVGSRGALGVITAAHVRLRPIADHDATWRLPMQEPAPADIEDIAREIEPVAMEWMDGELLVRVHGNEAALAAAAGRLDARRGAQRLSDAAADDAWRALAAREADAAFVARFHGLPSALPALIAAARPLCEMLANGGVRPRFDVTLAAHAGEGIVRVIANARHDIDFEGDDAARLALVLHAARDAAHAVGGGVRFEPLPAAWTGIDAFEPPGPELRLMRQIRSHFDPAGILVPGRWLA